MKKKMLAWFFGQAGEHYVLFRLWETGIIATMAPPGAPGVDILVYEQSYSLLATVQVKTRSSKAHTGWMVSRKQVDQKKSNHFYVFVDLDIAPNGVPTSYVVPSVVVADLARQVVDKDSRIAEQLSEKARESAIRRPRFVNFIVLKPLLDKPHPILGSEWQKGFENAFELLTMPIFRSAANRLIALK
jgi:hypothetical protein